MGSTASALMGIMRCRTYIGVTAEEIASGSSQPQERQREVTDRYGTYESALRVFWGDVGVRDDSNINRYFPGLMQSRMFDE